MSGPFGQADPPPRAPLAPLSTRRPAAPVPARPASLGELEQEFLDAMSSYYYEGKAAISDAEFDLLKDELLWAGSKVVVLDSDEQRFLEAVRSWGTGHPIMTDEEFDALRNELRTKGSIVAAQGPRCSLRTKKMYSDAAPDYLRMTALNVPAALLVLGLVFSVDDLTGFEITSLIELPPPYGIVALWGLILPVLYLLSTSITNLVLRDGLILKGWAPVLWGREREETAGAGFAGGHSGLGLPLLVAVQWCRSPADCPPSLSPLRDAAPAPAAALRCETRPVPCLQTDACGGVLGARRLRPRLAPPRPAPSVADGLAPSLPSPPKPHVHACIQNFSYFGERTSQWGPAAWWLVLPAASRLGLTRHSTPDPWAASPPRPPSPGDIFNVPGNRSSNTVECSNPSCRADLTFDYNKRVIAVDRTPEVKAEELAAAAAKKVRRGGRGRAGGWVGSPRGGVWQLPRRYCALVHSLPAWFVRQPCFERAPRAPNPAPRRPRRQPRRQRWRPRRRRLPRPRRPRQLAAPTTLRRRCRLCAIPVRSEERARARWVSERYAHTFKPQRRRPCARLAEPARPVGAWTSLDRPRPSLLAACGPAAPPFSWAHAATCRAVVPRHSTGRALCVGPPPGDWNGTGSPRRGPGRCTVKSCQHGGVGQVGGGWRRLRRRSRHSRSRPVSAP